MSRKLFLILLWFPLSNLFLIVLLINLFLLSQKTKSVQALSLLDDQTALSSHRIQTSVASAQTAQVLSATIESGDGRSVILSDYLGKHDSPLEPFASTIVSEADANKIDYRLVAAIAMCESNLGKRMPGGSYNAWGISIESGETSGATFKGWPDAIAWVSSYIREEYAQKGLSNLKSMGAKWAPPSVANGYSWTNCVDGFLRDIQKIAHNT